ncbi:hypothetical protein F0562_034404 [Nyssa sinensis]|uniref:Uncharacterized protein n=1 Tax=Nyssa sinensis TaxID=561372 RepID=A0A5J5AJN4_9ASTE|nr:hypothetical protein F0562_034404 [Nyssa sinensis]
MASSESTDDSFRTRVEKVFGSLPSSQPSSLRPLWSLTDDEVEKREWKRDRDSSNRDDETPCSSSFDGLFTKDRKIRRERKDDLEELDHDDDDDDDGRLGRGSSKSSFKHVEGDEKDEWEIRSSIGLDCTLDNEEEEDEYDRVAEGKENAGDRLYMRDVTDHGPFLNSHNVLPNSVHDAPRDPRTSHMDALIRLKEDEAAAQKFDSYQTCDKLMLNVEEPPIKESEDDRKLKPILKRKDNETASKPQKRVRFDLGCKDNCEEASEVSREFLTGTPSMETEVSDDESLLPKTTSRIPDYVLNPSKYTRYSFDSSSEFDEESNGQACMEFLKLVKKSKPVELGSELEDASADLPKSVTFIPRMKASDAKAINNSSEAKQSHKDASKQSLIQKSFPVGIAAGEAQQSEITVMEEYEPETNADGNAGFQKVSRHYRAKSRLDDPAS